MMEVSVGGGGVAYPDLVQHPGLLVRQPVLPITIDQIDLDRGVVEFLQLGVVLALVDEQILLEVLVVLDSQRQIENLAFAPADEAGDRQEGVQQVPYRFAGHRVAAAREAQPSVPPAKESRVERIGGRLFARVSLSLSLVLSLLCSFSPLRRERLLR